MSKANERLVADLSAVMVYTQHQLTDSDTLSPLLGRAIKAVQSIGPQAAEIARLSAALHETLAQLEAERARYSWQPIDSAPMDGTEILLYRGADTFEGKAVGARVTCGAWTEWTDRTSEYHATTGEYLGQSVQDGGAEWCSWDGGFTEEHPPTHWQPLPAPPLAIIPKDAP